jgi:hypothetical protein
VALLAVMGVDGVLGTRFGSGVCAVECCSRVSASPVGTAFLALRLDKDAVRGRRLRGGKRNGCRVLFLRPVDSGWFLGFAAGVVLAVGLPIV